MGKRKQPNRNQGKTRNALPMAHPGRQLGLSDEECKTADTHPQLKKLIGYLTKGDMDKMKQREFAKWRGGPKHEKMSEELRSLSDKLWAMVEEQAESLAAGAKLSREQVTEAAGSRGRATQATDYANSADPSALGEPFHNPYTFIPFGETPKRHPPTPLCIGEHEQDRQSGVLELQIQTLSPLLSCSPKALNPRKDHKEYRALTIGNDVIVPATGVRGALRTLMTILTGGTLGYADESLFLTQGRDLHLGPAGRNSPEGTPQNVFLAEVVTVGTANLPGRIRLGITRLVTAEALERLRRDLPRPRPGEKVRYSWADATPQHGDDRHADVRSLSDEQDARHRWKIKLSGRPVSRNKSKREGLFLPGDTVIDLPAQYWSDYQGRHRHGDHPELKPGDLVWLEPDRFDRSDISNASHIRSLQWARWGRAGESFLELLKTYHPSVIPDSLRDDGLVDEVTNLFGHIPHADHANAAPAFSARIRPENLVFYDARPHVEPTTLAPLSSPHPGCVAFYRDCGDLSDFAPKQPLRGYKVYRNTTERGDDAPWHYRVQGIYHHGRLRDHGNAQQKLNQTCELLREGITGTLRIAFRDLSQRELALLLLACSVDWRLGGGKPLGLGHCRVISVEIIDEAGSRTKLFTRSAGSADDYPPPADIGKYAEIVKDVDGRVRLWHTSQRPVDKLRYPRASDENNNTITIGGHVWFGRHAQPRKKVTGLEVLHVAGGSDLSNRTNGKKQIAPQPLPKLETSETKEDQLFGYGLHLREQDKQKQGQQNFIKNLEPFDADQHIQETHRSGGNQSQTRESRRQQKRNRGD